MRSFNRFALAVCTAFLIALPAQAQESTWENNMSKQLVTLLQSPSAATRAEAMKLTILLTKRNDIDVNLKSIAPSLIEIYQWDRDEAHRVMALAALREVRSGYATQRLAEEVQNETSPRVRRVAIATLSELQNEGR